jgi:hypothetical protein
MEKKYDGHICRRNYTRFPVDVLANAQIACPNGKIEKSLLVKDLSCQGAGIISEVPFNVNDCIGITITLPFSNSLVQRQVKVIWCMQIDSQLWRAGIDFGGLNRIAFPF